MYRYVYIYVYIIHTHTYIHIKTHAHLQDEVDHAHNDVDVLRIGQKDVGASADVVIQRHVDIGEVVNGPVEE
jgi:hypothetical protein